MTLSLLIAAPRSGSGKTTVTLALTAACRRRGLRVRTAKSGPDYIDPAFHEAASGAPCCNLDSWAMSPELLRQIAEASSSEADLLLIETSMGLFDGVGGNLGRQGRGADLAALFDLPVVLVIDVAGQSQSAAAVARGFAMHEAGVRICGVVANNVASPRHRSGVADALQPTGLPLFGCFMRDPAVTLPERHLGLVQAREHGTLETYLSYLADLAERSLDIDAVLAAAGTWASVPSIKAVSLAPPGQRIAVAEDAAFSFFYPHLRAAWRQAGAEIVSFSPLADDGPPDSCDACWLPGGYPELHAQALADCRVFKSRLRAFSQTRPVHGECGGYMVLGDALQDAAGATHAMAGLLSHTTTFARRRLHLGYRQATLLCNSVLGPAGAAVRGHEFHYASVQSPGTDMALAALRDALGSDIGLAGGCRGQVSGSFFHVIAPQTSETS